MFAMTEQMHRSSHGGPWDNASDEDQRLHQGQNDEDTWNGDDVEGETSHHARQEKQLATDEGDERRDDGNRHADANGEQFLDQFSQQGYKPGIAKGHDTALQCSCTGHDTSMQQTSSSQ